jgi:uncharacterized SAM-binding protein YcdF (DUF218 family)
MILFSLEKTLGLLVMPAGLIWLLILALAALCRRRGQRGPAALCLAIAVLYALAGNTYVAGALIATLERRVAPVELAALEPFDAVCVLGGGSALDDTGSPELSSAGDRIFLAARLWHAGKARLLVASGASRDSDGGIRDGGRESRVLWRAVGVPDRAILAVPEPCWNTRDEIKAYARLQARYGWKRMALVSSAAHLPRAMALASRAGLAFTPLGADRLGRLPAFQIQQLVPQGGGFLTTQLACWEYLGRWLGR